MPHSLEVLQSHSGLADVFTESPNSIQKWHLSGDVGHLFCRGECSVEGPCLFRHHLTFDPHEALDFFLSLFFSSRKMSIHWPICQVILLNESRWVGNKVLRNMSSKMLIIMIRYSILPCFSMVSMHIHKYLST